MSRAFTIAHYLLREASRSRLPVTVLAAAVLLTLASLMIRELALTDTLRLQGAFLAAGARLLGVLITASFIISTLQRELNERQYAWMLAAALPRVHYVLGKTLGFGLIALAVGVILSLPAAIFVPSMAWWAWAASLLLELIIVAALAVFCGLSLRSFTGALLFVLGVYVFARSAAALKLIRQSGIEAASATQRYLGDLIDLLALLVPRLDLFAPTRWLLDGHVTVGDLSSAALQTVVFVALLVAATTLDFQRRNF